MKQKSALELYEHYLKSLYAEDNTYYLIDYRSHYEIYNTLLKIVKAKFELSEKKEYTIHSFKTKKEMDESIEIRNTLQNQSVLFVNASIKDEQGQYAIVKEKELYYLNEVYKAEPKQLIISVLEFLVIYKAEKIKETNEHLKDYQCILIAGKR